MGLIDIIRVKIRGTLAGKNNLLAPEKGLLGLAGPDVTVILKIDIGSTKVVLVLTRFIGDLTGTVSIHHANFITGVLTNRTYPGPCGPFLRSQLFQEIETSYGLTGQFDFFIQVYISGVDKHMFANDIFIMIF